MSNLEKEYAWKVCVRCLTFNHAPYIEDAMNGFCMQETDFPFVCTIVDDASTDGEQDVIKRYLEEHFDLEEKSVVRNEETEDYTLTFARHKTNTNCYFAVLYLKYNHYSIKKTKMPYIAEWHENCKYIALCEGDDYWIDGKKLQKQVDFLENHSDYTMCFHAAIEHCENTSKKDSVFASIEDRDYKDVEIYKNWIVATASVLFRINITNSALFREFKRNEKIFIGDLPLFLTCCHYGKVYGSSKKMSVYRRHNGGITATNSSVFFQKLAIFHKEVPKIWGENLKKHSEEFFINNMVGAWAQSLKEEKVKWNFLKEAFKTSCFQTCSCLTNRLISFVFTGKFTRFF